ncbi:MAG TPA: undecaprenyl-diphosphate phosphatase [candidate division Zixibacteria bacterium]|nr:undecaprenyl-diphosphate phosphatase [candidate division Zixibacteria bacterium]
MSYLDAFILGLLQGLTEFLPVSSSGHLVMAQAMLGVKQPGVAFEVLAHLGTLGAVLVYFRGRIIGMFMSLWRSDRPVERRLIWYLIIGTVPAAIAGLLLKDLLESLFSQPAFAAGMLLVTGAILLTTRWTMKGSRDISVRSAIIMGVGQALAIVPGISRSGSTIAAGMAAGVQPSLSAEFSFLLAIPAVGGAALLEIKSLINMPSQLIGQYVFGAIVAFGVALSAVYLVLESIRRGKFVYFAYYCFAAGLVGLYLFL